MQSGLIRITVNDIFRTYEATPSGAPKNVRAESEGIKSIVVRWEPLADDVRNGDILGYTV